MWSWSLTSNKDRIVHVLIWKIQCFHLVKIIFKLMHVLSFSQLSLSFLGPFKLSPFTSIQTRIYIIKFFRARGVQICSGFGKINLNAYHISRNFSEDLILALLARLFRSLKLCITIISIYNYIYNNISCLEIM